MQPSTAPYLGCLNATAAELPREQPQQASKGRDPCFQPKFSHLGEARACSFPGAPHRLQSSVHVSQAENTHTSKTHTHTPLCHCNNTRFAGRGCVSAGCCTRNALNSCPTQHWAYLDPEHRCLLELYIGNCIVWKGEDKKKTLGTGGFFDQNSISTDRKTTPEMCGIDWTAGIEPACCAVQRRETPAQNAPSAPPKHMAALSSGTLGFPLH